MTTSIHPDEDPMDVAGFVLPDVPREQKLHSILAELVRCVRGGDETSGASMDDALMDADEILSEDETGDWISVSDRLPDDSFGSVLCFVDGEAWKAINENHYNDEYEGPKMIANTMFVRAWAGQFITHWMPLPSNPNTGGLE